MKRVLLIAHRYFEKEKIASIRTHGLIKYLPEFGWEVTLLTIRPRLIQQTKDVTILKQYGLSALIQIQSIDNAEDKNLISDITADIESKSAITANIKYMFNRYFDILYLYDHICRNKIDENSIVFRYYQIVRDILIIIYGKVDNLARWERASLKIARLHLKTYQYDVILSTFSPMNSHRIGSVLSDIYCIPWVADYRDLWSQNHNRVDSKWKHNLEVKNEVKIIAKASHISTVSHPLANDLHVLHNKMVTVIPNGFDPELVNPGIPLRPKFTITYTGDLYHGKRDPRLLLSVITELIEEKRMDPELLSIDFYGNVDSQLTTEIEYYSLDKIVIQHGAISKEDAIKMQCSSQLLLLITWDNPGERGVYTGKLFDYLAAKRPILYMGYNGPSVISDLLTETKAGVHPKTVVELKKQILEWYQEYMATGMVSYHGITERINAYNHRAMAKQFSDILSSVIS